MSQISLTNFFEFFKGTPNQSAAIKLLAEAMPESLLQDDAKWVLKYREPEPTPPPVPGIITPELMHRIDGL